MNLPNKLTIFRIILVPIIMLVYAFEPLRNQAVLYPALSMSNFLILILFIIGSVTDFLDGNIARRKGLKYREEILDHMGSTELGANVFRITQTEELLERQKISSEELASDTHYKVGKAVRNTIKQLGNTMPEDLPTPTKSIKELQKNDSLEIKN